MSPLDVYIHSPASTVADYKDILTWSIAVVSLVVTGLAVLASYILGRKYSDHVSEIKIISDKFSSIEKYYFETRDVHLRLTSKLELAFSTNVRFHEITGRLSDLINARQELRAHGILWGRPVTEVARTGIDANFMAQLEGLRTKQEARRYELLCLSTEYPVRLNHARYLAEIYGDQDSVRFLTIFTDSITSMDERAEYTKLLGALESRLGRTASKRPTFVSAKLWTG